MGAFVKDEYALGTHIEKQIHDAKVGDEAMLLLEHLIVCRRTERCVLLPRYLGSDHMAKIVHSIGMLEVFVRRAKRYIQPDEVAHQLGQLQVEVVEKRYLLLVERTEVVLVIQEEGSVAIGSLQGIPMLVSPITMIADANVAHQALSLSTLLGRDGECQGTIGVGNEATVAVGLLGIVVMSFDVCRICTALEQFAIVLYRRQIGGGE